MRELWHRTPSQDSVWNVLGLMTALISSTCCCYCWSHDLGQPLLWRDTVNVNSGGGDDQRCEDVPKETAPVAILFSFDGFLLRKIQILTIKSHNF